MPRDITVTFEDGSQAVYKNAPDNVTPEAATARAKRDYGLNVVSLDGGRATRAAPTEEAPPVTSPMGEDFGSAITAVAGPRRSSVLEGVKAPAPLPTEDPMLRPEFVRGVERRLGALPAEQRAEALDKLAQRKDVYGRAARVVQGRTAAMEKAGEVSPAVAGITDPRLETQVRKLIDEGGMAPDAAEAYARQELEQGRIPRVLPKMRAPTGAELALEQQAGEYQVDQSASGIEAAIKAVQRFGKAGELALGKAGGGMELFIGEMTGADVSKAKDKLGYIAAYSQAMGENPYKPLQWLESAGASIVQQLPALAAGAITGSGALALTSMYANSFADTYADSRDRGLDKTDSTARAAIYAAFEVLGEKLGLGASIDLIKASAKGKTLQELIPYFSKQITRDIPGEQLTYAGQFATDKGFGLNPEAGFADFLKGAAETAIVTATQSGLMLGTGAAASKTIRTVQSGTAKYALAKEINKEDFQQAAIDEYARRSLSPEFYSGQTVVPGVRADTGAPETKAPLPERPEGATPAQPPTPPAPPAQPPSAPSAPSAQPPVAAPEPTEETRLNIERLVAMGLDPEDAQRLAERMAAASAEKPAAPVDTTRVDDLTDEYIAAGLPPEQARALAIKRVQQEEEADKAAEGETRVAESVGAPSGAGAGVAGVADTGAPAGRPARAKRTGVVSPAEDAGQPAVGEGEQPSAITAEGLKNISTETLQELKSSFNPAEQKLIQAELDSRQGEAAAVETPTAKTPTAETPTAETATAEAPPAAPKTNEEILAAATDAELAKALTTYGGSEVGRLSPDLIQGEIAKREAAAKAAATAPAVSPVTATTDLRELNRTVKKLYEGGEEMSTDDLRLTKRKMVEDINDGLATGKSNDEIVEQLQKTARGTLTSKDVAGVQALLNNKRGAAPETKAEAEAESKAVEEAKAPTKTADDLYEEIRALKEQQQALLRKDGLVPFVNSPARKKYDALGDQIASLMPQWSAADTAERKAKAATKPKEETTTETTKPAETTPAKPRGRPAKETTPEDTEAAAKAKRQQTLAANKDARDVAAAGKLLNTPRIDQDTKQRAESIDRLYELSRRNKNKPGQRATELLNSDKVTQEERDRAKANYEANRRRGAAPLRMITPQRPSVVKERMPSLSRIVSRLRKLWGAGKITDAEFANGVADAQDQLASAKLKKPLKKRTRGTDYLMERLLRAKRTGELPAEGVELALWFLRQNPELGEDLGISIRKPAEGREYVAGQYDDIRRIIELIKGGDASTTIVHEIMHHLERMLPEDIRNKILKSWANALTSAASRAKTDAERKFFNLLMDYHFGGEQIAGGNALHEAAVTMVAESKVPYDFYQYVNPSEFWAVNAADILAGRHEVQGSVLERLRNWMSEFIEKVKDFFGLQSSAPIIRAIDKVLKGDGKFVTNLLLQEQDIPARQITPADNRTVNQIDKEVNKAIDGFETSATATDLADNVSLAQSLRDFDKFKSYFKGLYDKLDGARLSVVLGSMTNDVVAEWGGAYAPELKNTNKLLRKMRTQSRNLLEGAARLSEEVQRAIAADPSLKRKLERVTSVATDVRIDPAVDRRSAKLNALYDDLGPRGKEIYVKLRDYHATILRTYELFLDNQIDDANLPPGAKQVLMAEIKKMYETDKKIVPFFPFVRNRGDMWLQVGKGPNRQFYTFANEAERQTVMDYLAKKANSTTEQLLTDGAFVKGDTLESFRLAASDMTQSLKKVFEKIDDSVDPKEIVGRVAELTNVFKKQDPSLTDEQARAQAYEQAKEEATRDVKNTIYEMYLLTLPDQNFRRGFIARKDIPGYNVDLVRNFSTYATKTASQLARVKYGPKLRTSLRAAEKSLEGDPDASKKMQFVNEMTRRVDLELNPYSEPSPGISPAASKKVNQAVDFFTRLSFVHYLSAGASAIVQGVGFLYGMSTLGSRYGYARTSAELAKLTPIWNEFGISRKNEDGSVTYHVPSIVNSKSVNTSPLEKRFVRDMMGAGIGEYTITSEMLGRGRVSTAAFEGRGSKFGRGVMMVLGGPFQTIERLVQETLAIMAFRLGISEGRKKGLQGEELYEFASDKAIQAVFDSVGNMAEHNRPPILRNAGGRLLMQFLIQPLFITTRWMREAFRVVMATGGEAKFQAFKELSGILGVTWMLAGVQGLPFFSTIVGYLGAWLEDEDEKMGRKTFKDLDYWTWWSTVWLPQYLGKVGIFGQPLTEVVGMSENQLAALFLRGPANMLTGVDIASRTSINPTDMFSGQNKEVRTTKEGALQFAEDRAGPSVSMILSYMDAYDAFADGDIQRGMEKMLPAIARNPVIAFKYYNEGVKDFRGSTILSKDSMTTGRILYQAIGFRIDEVANQQKFNFAISKIENKIRFEREDILKNLRDSHIKKDFGRYRSWMDEARKFNKHYPSYAINDDAIVRSIEGAYERKGSAVRGFVPTEQNLPIFREAVLKRAEAMREVEERTKK